MRLGTLAALVLLLPGATRPLSAQAGLIPEPREFSPRAPIPLARGMVLVTPANSEDRFAVTDLREYLVARGVGVVPAADARAVVVSLVRLGTAGARAIAATRDFFTDSTRKNEGYVLVAEGRRVTIVGASAAGVFYGVQTLKQLVGGRGGAASLRGAVIRDWPAMRWRGFHDDLSRGPVPTLEFQKKQIRTFAAYKLNIYSPYFEHTLSYAANPLIAPPGGAMTRADVRKLVAYARRYHVQVVPEQEAFGHLHHVLKLETYAPLGETPHGHVLAPGDPATLPLIASWFREIDSLFPGDFIHIGADETDELGKGRSADQVAARGLGAVYLDFLAAVDSILRPTGRRILFWGDVAMNSPELVGRLPRGMIAVGWNYWSDNNFDRYLKPFRDAGMETWVAPGVSNWNRVWPDFRTALPNIGGFVLAGQQGGATGVLNTSWDDDGEGLFNETWYGVLFGAAAGWQAGESSIADFQSSFGRVFHGDTTGQIDEAQRELMAAHGLLAGAGLGDADDRLFWLDPWTDAGRGVTEAILPVASQLRLQAESALVLVAKARTQPLAEPDALDALELGARRIELIGTKYQFAEEIARMYAEARDSVGTNRAGELLLEISQANGRMQDIRDAFTMTRELFQAAWLRENRPYWIENVLARYDMEIQRWIARADAVSEARRVMGRTKWLPGYKEIGIPDPVAR
jgi:hexosaminidase